MIFPIALLIPLAASAACFLWFRRRAGGAKYWITVAKIAGMIAAGRIGVVALGAYLLENTSGWLQLPAYFMALCGLPEIYWMPRRMWGSVEGVARFAALLIPGSAAWTFALAALAARGRRTRSADTFPIPQ
jgi:hypothetical protein